MGVLEVVFVVVVVNQIQSITPSGCFDSDGFFERRKEKRGKKEMTQK